jgi:hypothetical protein
LGTWYLSLAASLLLILLGMYVHWTVVIAGLLLPFVPMVTFVIARRAERRAAATAAAAGDAPDERK